LGGRVACGFDSVGASVEGSEVVPVGAAVWVGDGVVDVAAGGGGGGAGEAADAFSGEQVVGECLAGSVAAGAAVDQVSGLRVGDQPPPGPVRRQLSREGCGDDPVAGDLTRMLGEAEQGGEVDERGRGAWREAVRSGLGARRLAYGPPRTASRLHN
jgi:hypothetical protein